MDKHKIPENFYNLCQNLQRTEEQQHQQLQQPQQQLQLHQQQQQLQQQHQTHSHCHNNHHKTISCNNKTKNNYNQINNHNHNNNNNHNSSCNCIIRNNSHNGNSNNNINHHCYYFRRNYLIKKMESGFYKFLARFSGRRRNLIEGFCKFISNLVFILIVVSLISVTEACSSRTTPKPRPPPTPAPRPNITFHTYKCPPNYAKWYCLNEATCFTVKIGDEILYNCECADGYMGPRCEYKDLDGSYLPTRPRVMLETASIASGATLAVIFVLILFVMLYVRWQQRKKFDTFTENGVGSGNGSGGIEGIDTIDGITSSSGGDNGSGPGGGGGGGGGGGVVRGSGGGGDSSSSRVMSYVKYEHLERRPFGPHHYYTIPMAATFKR